MDTKYEVGIDADDDRIVYVRPVDVAELPDEVREHAEGLDRVYAVHKSDGEQVAFVRDRKLAFLLANENDFVPVNVH